MKDMTNKYFGLSADCLKDKGFEYSTKFAGLDGYIRGNDVVLVDNDKIYRVFLEE